MSWLYNLTSLQGVSNIIGGIEIATAIGFLLHFYWKKPESSLGFWGLLHFSAHLVFYSPHPEYLEKWMVFLLVIFLF